MKGHFQHILQLEFGENVAAKAANRFAEQVVAENGHYMGQSIPILLADGDLLAREIYVLIVKGKYLVEGNDIAPVYAAEFVTGQQFFPLLERDQYHRGGPVFQNQPGIILPGFDIKNMPEFNFHKSAFLADKEKRLHLLRFTFKKRVMAAGLFYMPGIRFSKFSSLLAKS